MCGGGIVRAVVEVPAGRRDRLTRRRVPPQRRPHCRVRLSVDSSTAGYMIRHYICHRLDAPPAPHGQSHAPTSNKVNIFTSSWFGPERALLTGAVSKSTYQPTGSIAPIAGPRAMTFAASRWEAHVGHKTTVRLVQDAMHAAARAQSSKQLVLQQVQSKATLQEYIEFKKRVRHPVAPLWGARSLHWLVSACRKCSRERRRGGAERGISSLRGSCLESYTGRG